MHLFLCTALQSDRQTQPDTRYKSYLSTHYNLIVSKQPKAVAAGAKTEIVENTQLQQGWFSSSFFLSKYQSKVIKGSVKNYSYGNYFLFPTFTFILGHVFLSGNLAPAKG